MNQVDRSLLERVARQAMLDYGFQPDTPPAAKAQAEAFQDGASGDGVRDLRHLPWSSIDNPESRDLDQIECLETVDGGTKLCVGIADVAGGVAAGSPIDNYAAGNTTSVYTGVHTYAMLPARLSFDLTSLVQDEPRRAVVVEVVVDGEGQLGHAEVYPALVENHAKLNYPAVSAWLAGGLPPPALCQDQDLIRQVRDQDALASRLAQARKAGGALDFETGEARPVLDEQGEVIGLEAHAQDRAGAIIEEFMIAANRAVVKLLDGAGLPAIMRVVRQPREWPRIVEYAAGFGGSLPDQPDEAALSEFVDRMRRERPREFHEISLSIIKLIGHGEYVAHKPGDKPLGHFGLALEAYGHATAPNRRYADLATQRLLAPLLSDAKAAYEMEDVEAIAQACTLMEKQADKVERRVRKSIAAALLSHRVGQTFQGVVTKASPGGAFVRIFHPPAEGMVVRGGTMLRVGDKLPLRLLHVDVEQSLIDFAA
jgi:VacB/RNase II family 3'-5' exoribonuclease